MRIHRACGALFLLFLTGVLHQGAWAQSGAQGPPPPQGQNPNGMHIYLWAGLKSHLPGQHDYPQFLADWSKILTEHGAVVDGALHPPSSAALEHTDVVVIYKGDAGYMDDGEKTAIESFVKRGGGLVNLHDSLCGPDPAYLAKLLGGAKKHGEVNYTLDAPVQYTVVDNANLIMKDMSGITIFDEAFFNLTWAKDPAIHVLATTAIPPTRSAGDHKGEVVPQIWTYEHSLPGGQPARAFVWMQGHTYANFADYQIQRMLLRGIAWAGKRPVDELVDYVAPPHPVRVPREADAHALRNGEVASFVKDWGGKDADRIAAHYTDDAKLMIPNSPMMTGHAAIAKGMKEALADPNWSLALQPVQVEVSSGGDLGYTRGTYVLTATDPATTKAVTEKGRFLAIFRKQADGSWKAIQDINNAEAPAAAK